MVYRLIMNKLVDNWLYVLRADSAIRLAGPCHSQRKGRVICKEMHNEDILSICCREDKNKFQQNKNNKKTQKR